MSPLIYSVMVNNATNALRRAISGIFRALSPYTKIDGSFPSAILIIMGRNVLVTLRRLAEAVHPVRLYTRQTVLLLVCASVSFVRGRLELATFPQFEETFPRTTRSVRCIYPPVNYIRPTPTGSATRRMGPGS